MSIRHPLTRSAANGYVAVPPPHPSSDGSDGSNGVIDSVSEETGPPRALPDPPENRAAISAPASHRSNVRTAMFVVADGLAAALAVGVAGGTVPAILAFAAAAIAADL